MRRREFLAAILGAGALSRQAHAQQTRVFRVGVLMDGSLPALRSFRNRLQELGYVEGRNLELLERWGEARVDLLTRFGTELVNERIDLIFTYGSRATLAAKAATATVPIVTGAVSDAVVSELFASLARPGGNVTGFIGLATAAWSKRLALAKELLPGLSRVGYLTLVGSPSAAAALQIVAEAGRALKVSAELIEFTDPGAGLATAFKDRSVDAVLVSTGDAFRHRIGEVAAFMAGRRLPALYGSRDAVEAGGLMSYGPDYDDLFRRAAEYADRILRGEKPGDLPAQQAERFELVINLKTAKALGLEIPPTLLARADEVIE